MGSWGNWRPFFVAVKQPGQPEIIYCLHSDRCKINTLLMVWYFAEAIGEKYCSNRLICFFLKKMWIEGVTKSGNQKSSRPGNITVNAVVPA